MAKRPLMYAYRIRWDDRGDDTELIWVAKNFQAAGLNSCGTDN